MRIKDKILAVLTGCGAVASAVFYVLFKQARAERLEAEMNNRLIQEEKNKAQQATEIIKKSEDVIVKVNEKLNEGRRENEKLKQNLNSNDVDTAINASDKLLDDIRRKGSLRNRV